MEKCELKIGQIMQINPDHATFGGFLLVVTEPFYWGCMGYLVSEYEFEAVRFKGRAFLRVTFEYMEPVGFLEWMWDESKEEV